MNNTNVVVELFNISYKQYQIFVSHYRKWFSLFSVKSHNIVDDVGQKTHMYQMP